MLPLQTELQQVLDRYVAAYAAQDATGCASVFVSDGAVYSAFAVPALGRQAIEALHRDWVSHGGSDKSLVIESFGGAQDSAWCLARFSEGRPAVSGMSLMAFDRDASGNWLIRVCSLTSLS